MSYKNYEDLKAVLAGTNIIDYNFDARAENRVDVDHLVDQAMAGCILGYGWICVAGEPENGEPDENYKGFFVDAGRSRTPRRMQKNGMSGVLQRVIRSRMSWARGAYTGADSDRDDGYFDGMATVNSELSIARLAIVAVRGMLNFHKPDDTALRIRARLRDHARQCDVKATVVVEKTWLAVSEAWRKRVLSSKGVAVPGDAPDFVDAFLTLCLARKVDKAYALAARALSK